MERLPEWLVGRHFVLIRSEEGPELEVGRFGSAERIRLDPGERVVAMVDDRVVGATPVVNDDEDTLAVRFAVWSLRGGGPITEPVEVPGDAHLVGGGVSDVLVPAGAVPPTRGHGVLAISSVDGSWRWLIEPPAYDTDRPARVLAVSETGDRFATSMCREGMESVYDCGRVEIRRVNDGTVVARVDTGGQPIQWLGTDWLVVGEYGLTAVVDVEGNERWSSRDLGPDVTVGTVAPLGSRLIAEVGGFGGTASMQLVAFDILTGRAEVLYDPGDRAWRFWPALSTDRFIVIGDDFGPPLVPDIVEAGVIDLGKGLFDPYAIRVDLAR